MIEFRLANEPWESHESNRQLSFNPNTSDKFHMRQGHKSLVDVNSHLHSRIIEALGVLDAPENIVIVQIPDNGIVAELSRLHLKFTINSRGTLECKGLGAIVDDDQEIGCLYGCDLKNSWQRSVIVPYGIPEVLSSNRHVRVIIRRPAEKRVRYIQFVLDEHLQCLRGPLDHTASLYQAYLHALTAYPLPDPFTRRSGTEEALRLLK